MTSLSKSPRQARRMSRRSVYREQQTGYRFTLFRQVGVSLCNIRLLRRSLCRAWRVLGGHRKSHGRKHETDSDTLSSGSETAISEK